MGWRCESMQFLVFNDVDLTISIHREELPVLFESLRSIGCEIPIQFSQGWQDSVAGMPLFNAEFLNTERSIEMDVFVAETEFQRSLIQRRQLISTSGGEVSFVSPEDLILLKLIASKPRDLIDVQDILFTMGQLDSVYLEKWAEELSVTEGLRSALAQHEQENGGEPSGSN